MEKPSFVIEASDAKLMAQSSGLTLTQLLPNLVKSAQPLARVPISNFHVAAIGVGISGRIFVGVNVEFPGLPFHHTIHAEQFLLTNLSQNKETQLQWLAVSAAPCGHCRQFLQEIRGASGIPLLITSESSKSKSEFTPLSEFLSHPFGPYDLLPIHVPLLLEPRNNHLSFLDHLEIESISNVEPNGYNQSSISKLKVAALEAANNSHAPYSDSPSGVALMDSHGNVYKGSYMESAAYNPSLGPVQTAIIAFIAGDGAAEYEELVEAVLVERKDAVIKQENTARLLLSSISPRCRFKVSHCISNNKRD